MELIEFLKKYSSINNDFIDDFFKTYDAFGENEFSVDFEKICKWLEIRKDSIKRTLDETYKLNTDYIVKSIQNTKHGGNNRKQILLTPETFKRICMLSKSKKAEEVRTYFILLEKLIDKYKNYITVGLQKRVKNLENNQKPKINPANGVIYIFKTETGLDNVFKIGKSTNLKKRLQSHNSSHADDLEIVYVFETNNIDQVEKCLKAVLKEKQYRKYKEIYEIDINIVKELLDTCETMVLKVKKPIKKFKQTGGYFIFLSKKQ